MTVPATLRRAGPYDGNGVATSFGFSFKTFDAADLRVVRLNTTTGVESDAVLNSDYTVVLNPDQESNPGGTVTFSAAPASNFKITIVSLMSYAQPVDLPDGGAYRAQQIEDGLDRLAILVQQLDEENQRALKLPVSAGGASTNLPTPGPFQLIGWNSDGSSLQNYSTEGLGVSVVYASWRTETFNGTGAQVSFVLQFDAGSSSNIDLRVNNVPQTPGVNYTYNNTNRTITFLTGAPPAGTGNVVARYGQALSEPNIDAAIASAQSSATAAANSASTATTQAGVATTQASAASASATSANNSATAAAASASSASTSASNASTSATNAANSATAAANSASSASTSATNAANSATDAASIAASIAPAPPGAVLHFAQSTPPSGWLVANGSQVSRTTFAALFAAIGTTFGAGDGSTTFNLPDLRGEFIRGHDQGRGVDTGRGFGSAQGDAFQGHEHRIDAIAFLAGGAGVAGSGVNVRSNSFGAVTDGTNGAPRTANETRPRNVAMLACIKF